jgi:hypothetical protein
MAVAAYGASLTAGGTLIHDIDTFDLPFERDLLETTSFSNTAPGTKTFIPGLLGMESKLSGNWNVGDAGQLALEDAFFAGTIVNLVATIDTKTYTFDCYIGKYTVSGDVQDKATCEYSITMNGNVTRA